MNRLVFVAATAYAACMSPVFAQSNTTVQSSVLEPSTTTFPSASIAQNFQYINHPLPPAPASSVSPGSGGRGGRHHRQMSGDSDTTGAASAQP
ncbi:hypothetical protein PQR53_20465 [Paraburkholderia fungorum]|uniref:hypothetical protein n=1 Tax=Paraburkholderia fungorum TaxID=134537 RepID=UPI0038B839CA